MLYNRDHTIRTDPALALHIGIHPDHVPTMAQAAASVPGVGGGSDGDAWLEWGEPPTSPDVPVLLSARAPDEASARAVAVAWLTAAVEHGIPLAACPATAELPAVFIAASAVDEYSDPVTTSWLAQVADSTPGAVLVIDADVSHLLLVRDGAPSSLTVLPTDRDAAARVTG